jgi:hypothetical protein
MNWARRLEKKLMTYLRKVACAGIIMVFLSACASVDYSQTPAGRFTGSVFVMWVSEGNESGDGNFLFVPDPRDRLTFTRHDPHGHGVVIQPGLMYTDGGSIPKIAQVFKGLSPWGYAPAYMIHDWLFVARHCLVDGEADPRFNQVRDVDFDDSATILAEAIRALVASQQVQPNDLAGETITTAVDSVVAKELWDKTGACAESHVRPKDVASAEDAIPGSTTMFARAKRPASLGQLDVQTKLVLQEARKVQRSPAKVVAHITFGH